MFSITADGVLFLDGTRVGRLEVNRDKTQRDGMRLVEITSHGLVVDSAERGDTVLYASIASAGAEREVRA